MKENDGYQLIPNSDGDLNSQWWNVRILKGEFVETVIGDIVLSFDEKKKQLKFAFSVISSPNEEAIEENPSLQQTVAEIINDIIEREETNLTMKK